MNAAAIKSAVMTQGGNAYAEPVVLRERIGSTTFEVTVHFSKTSNETMEDKILRLILTEADRTDNKGEEVKRVA